MPDQEGEEYSSYDPTEVALHDAEEADTLTADPVEGERVEEKALPEFDERYRDTFTGLMFIGALSKKFEWMGHTFVVRTLTTDELIAVGLITKEFQDTIAGQRAYATAMVACATISVDGESLPIPVEEREDFSGYDWARKRFDHVKARWYPYTVDRVYNEYMVLEGTVAEVIEAMGKASG